MRSASPRLGSSEKIVGAGPSMRDLSGKVGKRMLCEVSWIVPGRCGVEGESLLAIGSSSGHWEALEFAREREVIIDADGPAETVVSVIFE